MDRLAVSKADKKFDQVAKFAGRKQCEPLSIHLILSSKIKFFLNPTPDFYPHIQLTDTISVCNFDYGWPAGPDEGSSFANLKSNVVFDICVLNHISSIWVDYCNLLSSENFKSVVQLKLVSSLVNLKLFPSLHQLLYLGLK